MEDLDRSRAIKYAKKYPRSAHEYFFESRHPYKSAKFHFELITDWYSPAPYIVHKAFRGAAKSTKAEEAIALMACLNQFQNCVIIKASETRAKEALTAIKAIYSTNDLLIDVFGDMHGDVTSETKLVLRNGVAIQAAGKRQSLRGMKHNTYRPDLLFGDDMEDEEDVRTPEAHSKFMKWLYAEVLPSLQQPNHRVRIVGTPLADSEQCMIEKMVKNPSWKHKEIPVKYYDEDGNYVSAWPEMFPLEKLDALEYDYRRVGRYETFAREYLVQGTPKEGQTYDSSMFRVVPHARTWQAVYAAFDPARTTSEQAAFTGWAVWSIFGSRIHVWESGGAHIAPDEIQDKIFEINSKYNPIFIGVEKDGLELFLMQPLRAAQLQRGVMLPLRALRAPRDRSKIAFLEGLQPFAKAGEITFNEQMEQLTGQFVSFPKGRNDIINALAYSLILRGGIPVYDFPASCIDEDLQLNSQDKAYVVFNSDGAYTAAVICQYSAGIFNIISDYIMEGTPAERFPDIYAKSNLDIRTSSAARVKIGYVAGPQHFAMRDVIGLKAAATRAQVTLGQGGQQMRGRSHLQSLMRMTVRGRPAFNVNPLQARWTVQGLAGGFYKVLSGDGQSQPLAEQNYYAIVVEAIESFAAAMQGYEQADDDSNIRYASTADGRTYITSRR